MITQAPLDSSVQQDAGVNVGMMQDINMELQPGDNAVADGNANAGQRGAQNAMNIDEEAIPHHPDQPQDTISFNQSRSTMNYLRTTGSDIHLTVEEVMADIQNSTSSDGSDSPRVQSALQINMVLVPPFILKACQKLPTGCKYTMPVQIMQAKTPAPEWKEDTSKAIAPVLTFLDPLLVRLWAALFGQVAPVPEAQVDNAGLSFPSATSTRPGSKTPLVNTLVRRSTRLNPCAVGGVQVIKMKEPASKRRKKYMINLDAPPANADEAADPTPLNIL